MGSLSSVAVLLCLAVARGVTGSGEFVQLQCADSACQECDQWTFPTDSCQLAQNGLHAKGICEPEKGVLRQVLWTNNNCQGTPLSTTEVPLKTCIESIGGNYFENLCPTSYAAPRSRQPAPPMLLLNTTLLS
eukprot:Sspe_Gene.84025::Locus_55151_Transcript_1_2_Confidence_0.750_Length_965::g.84025::m.84025